MRVLVAEDDPTSRCLLTALLSRWGYEPVAVTDGLQALQQFQKPKAPKLAILDWLMPGLDGVQVCEAVRKLPAKEPPYIIILTSLEQKKDTVRALQAGANDYITKPHDPNELQARLAVGKRVIELQEALVRRVSELEDALAHLKTLQGILPICMHCHKIRSDQESWQRVEKYISEHSEATFSHGICPECMERYYSPAATSPRSALEPSIASCLGGCERPVLSGPLDVPILPGS